MAQASRGGTARGNGVAPRHGANPLARRGRSRGSGPRGPAGPGRAPCGALRRSRQCRAAARHARGQAFHLHPRHGRARHPAVAAGTLAKNLWSRDRARDRRRQRAGAGARSDGQERPRILGKRARRARACDRIGARARAWSDIAIAGLCRGSLVGTGRRRGAPGEAFGKRARACGRGSMRRARRQNRPARGCRRPRYCRRPRGGSNGSDQTSRACGSARKRSPPK
jgi:hypothetical protein